jgi:hypothetical protein
VYHRRRTTLFTMWVTLGGLTCLVALVVLLRAIGL